MAFQQFSFLVSQLVSGPLQIHGDCPRGQLAAQQLTACLTNFNSLTSFSKVLPTTATQFNTYCNSSGRTTEIECAENIIKVCKQADPTTNQFLEKTVNINAIKDSVRIVCSNVQVFADKYGCLGRYQAEISLCIQNEFSKYKSVIQSLKLQALSEGDEYFEEKAYEELCDYVVEIAVCMKPYKQNCGTEMAGIFDNLLDAATPPACGGNMEHVNLALLITLAFVALVKGKW